MAARDDSTYEQDRLLSLRKTRLLDSPPEAAYDAIVELAGTVAGTPISFMSLVDRDRQWFKAARGVALRETSREIAFCSHAIERPFAPFIVPDARADARFAGNPLVTDEPRMRFYAGFPITDEAHRGIGTLCVADRIPRRLSIDQLRQLWQLTKILQELIRLRCLGHDLDDARNRARLFERSFERAGIGKQVVAPDGRILRVNQAFASMIGLQPEAIVGRGWWEFAHPDERAEAAEVARQRSVGQHEPVRRVDAYLHRTGSKVWATIHVVPVLDDDTGERLDSVEITDITDTIEAQMHLARALEERRRSERQLSALITPSPDPVFLLTAEGLVEAANPAALDALSPSGRSIVGLPLGTLAIGAQLCDELQTAVRESLEHGEPSELPRVWFEPATGPGGWYRFRVFPVQGDEGAVSAYVHAVDVTEAAENEQRLAALALVDPLTGAANRAALYDRLDQALARLERRHANGVAVVMVDLDHFKALNDTSGHHAGDTALVNVAHARHDVVRAQDTVARIGGDEFVVMLDDVTEHEARTLLAPRLADALGSVTVELPGGSLFVGGSLGLAWTDRRVSGTDLLSRADRAMRQAKSHGRGRLWTAQDDVLVGPYSSDLTLRRDLAAALARGQFALRYQPIVDADGRLCAAEALLRWIHPEHGELLPASFIGTLIETGLIATVGHWVLRQVVLDAARLPELDGRALALHVNLSPGEIASTQLRGVVQGLLHDTGLDPARLVVEVTEQALMGTVVSTSAISELTSTGVRLSLDDFGTGSSSLSHLRQRPLHSLKLDRSFVAGIGRDETDMAIVSGAIAIARRLGLDVVAEGVETEAQREWLLAEGCTHLQGWLVVRPRPVEELVARPTAPEASVITLP
ncbi:MAG: EAL domain-containing protein [Acidimicrobiales bacterium]|nr:EAL domain-containing protein [Acidimicrobiales bacterium]